MKRKLVLALLAMTMITSTVPVAMPVMAYASDDVQAQSAENTNNISITVDGYSGVTAGEVTMDSGWVSNGEDGSTDSTT